MTIAWNAFTPLHAVIGGSLIGCSAAAMFLLLGRIAGISGVLGGVLHPTPGEGAWRLAFLGGLFTTPFVLALFAPLPVPQIDASPGTLVLAGFAVGLGTRYGSGCTSGHGVCGVSRLSRRSLVATLAFMLTGFLTVAALRHVAGA